VDLTDLAKPYARKMEYLALVRDADTDFYGAEQENDHKQPFELHPSEPPILAGGDHDLNRPVIGGSYSLCDIGRQRGSTAEQKRIMGGCYSLAI